MPNRILTQAICTDDAINSLSFEAERFFYRLLVCCNEFGVMDARPHILRPKCFPLRMDTISREDIIRWKQELENAQLINSIEEEGEKLLVVRNFDKYNTGYGRRLTRIKTAPRRERIRRDVVIEREGKKCYLCGKELADDEITLDHVIPLAHGGSHTEDNLKVACRSCNASKGANY